MPSPAKYRTAWGLTLAPIVLFIPALMLAGMGSCSFAHPSVLVIAFLFFVGLEIAAVPRFIRAARSAGKAPIAMIGIAMAFFFMVLSAVLEYYFVAEYWA